MDSITRQMKRDVRLIGKFTELWCRGKRHPGAAPHALEWGLGEFVLCPDCAAFIDYAAKKRVVCPLETQKPTCKRCKIHCYAPSQRAMVRDIMSWSGRRMIMRGRIDYLYHYLF